MPTAPDILPSPATTGSGTGFIDHPAPPGPWLQLSTPAGWEYNRATLPIANLNPALDGFKIIHLSDIHFKNRKKWSPPWDEVLARIAQSQADLVLITGDFVDNKKDHRPALPKVFRLLEGLRSRLGAYGILGNHDGPLLAARLKDAPITLLHQERREIDAGNGARLELIGLPGIERDELDPYFLRSLPSPTPGIPRIALSHYPDTIRRTDHLRFDLVLAGHTHGGQCCLPNGAAIVRHDSLPRRYAKGIHRWRQSWFVINKGIGFSSFDFRVFCPAEVLEITLAAAACANLKSALTSIT